MSMKRPHTFLEPLAHTGPDIEIGNLSSKPRDPTGLAHGRPLSRHYCPPHHCDTVPGRRYHLTATGVQRGSKVPRGDAEPWGSLPLRLRPSLPFVPQRCCRAPGCPTCPLGLSSMLPPLPGGPPPPHPTLAASRGKMDKHPSFPTAFLKLSEGSKASSVPC